MQLRELKEGIVEMNDDSALQRVIECRALRFITTARLKKQKKQKPKLTCTDQELLSLITHFMETSHAY
jgi:hypothetical protein